MGEETCDDIVIGTGTSIQNDRAKAKPYQVRQVLWAIDRLERNDEQGN